MDPQPAAPPVVAVVVTSEAGPWLEEHLSALGAQDYPVLSVLVIDAASTTDPTPRVASVLPGAYIRRLDENAGYGASVNHALSMVEGAAFFLLCHDDVAPAPDAVRLLVEEALRSNAGIVGPKLVSWDDPERLLQVGLGVDRTGTPSPLVERGELDQEQHDAVRDVFAVPGGLVLVRADLFAELGGFDAAITLLGDDVDLCWRAQLAGARVVVAPQARVRHLEALPRRRPVDDRRRLQTRHRVRSLLKCSSLATLLLVLPRVLALMFGEILYALATGRRTHAADIAGAWTWNLSRWKDLRRVRRDTQRHRRVPDRDVHRLMTRRNARLRVLLQGGQTGDDRAQALAAAGRDLLGSVRAGPRRAFLLVWAALIVVLLAGSRDLLGKPLPSVGSFAPFPEHATTLLRYFTSGWRESGLGREAPAPTAFGLLGTAGLVLLGGMGVLQKLLTVGLLPLGAFGAWRLTRPLTGHTGRARLVAPVVYAAIPLPYNAFAQGRWGALVAYAAMPFVVARLLAATGLEPFGGDPRPLRHQVFALALVVAAAAALAPAVALLVLATALALVAGSLVAGGVAPASRALGLAGLAVLGAAVLCFPWVLDLVLPGAEASGVLGVAASPAHAPGLAALLRFETGPLGAPPIGWAFLVAGLLPLLIGREWRLAWAIRLWALTLASYLAAWAAGRGWLGDAVPPAEVLLAPGAVALTVAVALGLVAFELDLPGYRFGWRQVASLGAATCVAVGTLPVLGAALDGRWNLPGRSTSATLSWMRPGGAGDFRVLWIGDPGVLPQPGWRLADGVAYALSRNGTPTVVDQWPSPSDGPTRLVADALGVARSGGTARLGRLLAPMAIRYVVVPQRLAPGSGPARPVPGDLVAALAAQLDFRRVTSEGSLTVYENVAAMPARSALPADADLRPGAAATTDLSAAAPVLRHARDTGPAAWSGSVPAGTTYLSEASSSRWELRVDGRVQPREKAFGWANAFRVERGGAASLAFRTRPITWALVLLEVVFWGLAIRFALRRRREAVPPAPTRAAGPRELVEVPT